MESIPRPSPFRGFSIPELASVRGAGLGNELFPWAKALIGAYELGLVPLQPAWALNPRGYRRDFGTSRLDWLAQRGLRLALPEIRVTGERLSGGEIADYGELMRSLRPELERRRTPVALVHASGMAGGFAAIAPARLALESILFAPGHVARDLYAVERRRRPERLLVGVHVRAGHGFADGPPTPGEFNRRLPESWYAHVIDAVADSLGADRIEVVVTGDAPAGGLPEQLARRDLLLPLPARSRPLLSDLRLLVEADLLVCSVSSFSLLAAFLGKGSYVWYGPHLAAVDGGRAIWPEERPPVAGGEPEGRPRGLGLAEGEPLPDWLVTRLEALLAAGDRRFELIYGGVVA